MKEYKDQNHKEKSWPEKQGGSEKPSCGSPGCSHGKHDKEDKKKHPKEKH